MLKKYLLSELSESEVRWSMSYVGLSWAAELGNGAIQTITGIIDCSCIEQFYGVWYFEPASLANNGFLPQ